MADTVARYPNTYPNTLIFGRTAAGENVPVLVDSAGKLIVISGEAQVTVVASGVSPNRTVKLVVADGMNLITVAEVTY